MDIWGVCSMGVGPEFAPRSHTLQILFYIQFNLIGYEPMFDFSQEEYEVIVFDGIDIKVRVFSTAKDALDAKRVFIKAGWSVEVTIINNVFDNK